MNMKWLWLFPGIGAVLLAGAIALQVHRHVQQAGMSSAEGVVVAVDADRCPVIGFLTADGEPVAFHGKVCGGGTQRLWNKKVRVLYDAANPQHAYLDGFRRTGLPA